MAPGAVFFWAGFCRRKIVPGGRAFRRLNRRSEEKSRMSCRQAFRRRCEAIAREAVGAVPATMFRPALAGRMIGATLPLRTFGSCARNFPRRRFRARRSPWWTLWTGWGAAGCPQVHRGRDSRENRASKAQYILPWRSYCPGRSRFAVRQRRSLDSPARRTSASISLPCHSRSGARRGKSMLLFRTFLLLSALMIWPVL